MTVLIFDSTCKQLLVGLCARGSMSTERPMSVLQTQSLQDFLTPNDVSDSVLGTQSHVSFWTSFVAADDLRALVGLLLLCFLISLFHSRPAASATRSRVTSINSSVYTVSLSRPAPTSAINCGYIITCSNTMTVGYKLFTLFLFLFTAVHH